ncbi:MAG: uroporphyrinogen decarboxylase family protein [Desulfobacteraceae bacterium]|jgi:uroporphyrinogen decarboxylase
MEKNQTADRMTARERIKALILNQPIDRVPFIPFFLGYLALNNGLTLYDFFTKPHVAFKAGLETMKAYPWATIRPAYDWADHGAWEFGGKIGWPKTDEQMTPLTPEPLIKEPLEVDSLGEPDPLKTDWFRHFHAFNEICVQHGFSAQLPSASIMSPMSSILGGSNLMKWMIRYPEAVHRVAEKVLRFNMKVARITLERYGAKNCSVTTQVPLESNHVISADAFEAFCLPYISKLHGLYLESGVRATMIHLCGDHKRNLKYWKEVPLPERAIFSIGDDMDLKGTGDFLGEKFILAGNMSTTILQLGTMAEVKEEARRCLRQGKTRPGGFILMPACEWPPMAPPEHLVAVREALMEHGFY